MGSQMIEGDTDWTYHLKNVCIYTLAIALGFASFFFYESPHVMKAKGKSALSIIATGFLGVAMSMILL